MKNRWKLVAATSLALAGVAFESNVGSAWEGNLSVASTCDGAEVSLGESTSPETIVTSPALPFTVAWNDQGQAGGNVEFSWTDSEDIDSESWSASKPEGCDPPPEHKVLICHRDQGKPEWKVIEIAENALETHLTHQWGGDIYPVPANGCPQPPPPPVDCPDGSQVPAGQECPPVECEDGTTVPNGSECPVPTTTQPAENPQLDVSGSCSDETTGVINGSTSGFNPGDPLFISADNGDDTAGSTTVGRNEGFSFNVSRTSNGRYGISVYTGNNVLAVGPELVIIDFSICEVAPPVTTDPPTTEPPETTEPPTTAPPTTGPTTTAPNPTLSLTVTCADPAASTYNVNNTGETDFLVGPLDFEMLDELTVVPVGESRGPFTGTLGAFLWDGTSFGEVSAPAGCVPPDTTVTSTTQPTPSGGLPVTR